MDAERDDPIRIALEELGRTVLDLRRQNHALRQEVDRLRRFELAVRSGVEFRSRVRPVLAAISWAEDLEEAHDLAARALRDVFDHDVPPDEDDSSISPEKETSK